MRLLRRAGEGPISCPRCTVELEPERVEVLGPDVWVDVCPGCGGSWYDRGEVSKVIKDRRLQARLVEFPDVGRASELSCPRCGCAMRVRSHLQVEVDACTGCMGVWLDAGEADSMRARHEEAVEDEDDEVYRTVAFYSILRDLPE